MKLFPETGPRVFTIPPGLPFAQALADGVRARRIAAGLGPEALIDLDVVVSTERARRALRSAFMRAEGGAALGPRLSTLSDLTSFQDLRESPPPAISSGQRLLSLARLVRALFQRNPDLGAPISAPKLAADLASLLDAAHMSGVSLDRLDEITTDDHAAHWALSKSFLDIIRAYWPAQLASEGRIDAAERNRLAVAELAHRWRAAPPARPILIAGSTGSMDTSAWFIELVSRLPQGAVVLPGLDVATDDPTALALAKVASPEHPQSGLARLIERIGVARHGVLEWVSDPREDGPARLRLLSQALRPAPVTDAWRDAAAEIAGAAALATQGLSLIEAPGPREEAAAIALALREAIETPEKKAALITPDRTLARRVSAELARWGIAADDSGGRPLSLTPPGVYFALIAELAVSNLAPSPLLALLKHPLTQIGRARGVHARATRRFERQILRGMRPGAGLDAIVRAIADAEIRDEGGAEIDIEPIEAIDAGAARNADAPADIIAATETPPLELWFEGACSALAPFLALCAENETTLEALLDAHIAAAEALTAPARTDEADPDENAKIPAIYLKSAGETLRGFTRQLRQIAGRFGEITPGEYCALLGQLMSGESVREAFGRHPRVLILGPLEARMQSADLVILAGLNEGIWPRIPEPDPWISRDMRAALGLPPLESRIGLSAHDFFQAVAAKSAILSRARKSRGAPTVASRWLLRLTNLLGGAAPEALTAMRARGTRYLEIAGVLDSPAELAPAPRPKPAPPIDARPTEYAVTEIERLIRDPYAVYARRVLNLRPLPPLEAAPDMRDRGEALHEIVQRFIAETKGVSPDRAEAAALFDAIANETLAPFLPWPTQHALWRARAARFRDWFLESEATRRDEGRVVALECDGEFSFKTALAEKTKLKARADRIDLISGEGYAVYDYKTGAPPSAKQVAQFARQLPLEAAIAVAGGFKGVEAGPVARLSFLRLGGDGGENRLNGPAAEMAEAAVKGVVRLLSSYADETQPYLARSRPEHLKYEGDFDHLARLGEWEDGA